MRGFKARNLVAHAHVMRDQMLRWTTIPTCVGIANTKTLGKRANAAAKKNPLIGSVADLRDATTRA